MNKYFFTALLLKYTGGMSHLKVGYPIFKKSILFLTEKHDCNCGKKCQREKKIKTPR